MSEHEIPPLKTSAQVIDLGCLDYRESLERQLAEHQRVVDGGPPVFLLVEHPPVLTLGKNADLSNLLLDRESLARMGVLIAETDRGGEVTAHVPGQLVVYPIIPVTRFELTPRRYVNLLEESVIRVLEQYDIAATRDSEHPGVWVGGDKICAVGIRIRTRVAMHGFALNVNNEFGLFETIIPCGIRARGVTSLQKELGQAVPMDDVKERIVFELSHALFQNKIEPPSAAT